MTPSGGITRRTGLRFGLLRPDPSDTHLCTPSSPYLTLFQAVRNLALNLSTSSGSAGSVPDDPRAAPPDPEGPRLLGSGTRVCPLGRRPSGRRASSGLPLRYCAAAGDTEFMDAPGRKDAGVPRGQGNCEPSSAAPWPEQRYSVPGAELPGPAPAAAGTRGSITSAILAARSTRIRVGVACPLATPCTLPPPLDSPHPPYLTAQARGEPLQPYLLSEPGKSRTLPHPRCVPLLKPR